MTSSTAARRTVADHLLDRLAELGVRHVFGVPGDFTLGFLDHVDAHPLIEWVGTANELGAGYAADGYARLRGIGVVCTTFGVGELSAINAVAGSYAEHVPVLHLVGCPSTSVQGAARPTHHSLGDGDFGHTMRMTAEVTVDQAMLGADDPCGDIDRVLTSILVAGQPGYLSVPTDVAELPAPELADPLSIPAATSDPSVLDAFTTAARRLLAADEVPVVLADIFVNRAGAEAELHALIERGRLPFATLLWGRRVVDESLPSYLGTYIGVASDPVVCDAVEDAPCLITAGVHFTDLISAGFSERLDDERRIDVLPHAAVVAGTTFAGIEMGDALRVLAELVRDGSGEPWPAVVEVGDVTGTSIGALAQTTLWDEVADALRPGDVLLAEQGTAFYGISPHRLPHDVTFVGQPLWAAIGYTLPATLGAALAAPERRPVLLIGDGAAQLTIQELGTIVRHRIPALIVVVNNDGYTVERAIHGPTKPYNDIAPWRWTELPRALGADDDRCHAVRVESSEELRSALADAAAGTTRLTLIEAVTGRLDVPPLLRAVADAAANANRAG